MHLQYEESLVSISKQSAGHGHAPSGEEKKGTKHPLVSRTTEKAVPSVGFQPCAENFYPGVTCGLCFLEWRMADFFLRSLVRTPVVISLAHAVLFMRIVKSSADRNMSIQAIHFCSPHCGVVFPSTAAAARGHAANRPLNNSVEVGCVYDGCLKLRKNYGEGVVTRVHAKKTCQRLQQADSYNSHMHLFWWGANYVCICKAARKCLPPSTIGWLPTANNGRGSKSLKMLIRLDCRCY
jgi:hypothetical protein